MQRMYVWFVKRRKLFFFYLCVLLSVFAWGLLLWEVPTDLYVTRNETISLKEKLPVTLKTENTEQVFAKRWKDQYQVTCHLFGFIPVKSITVHVVEETYVTPVGEIIGIVLDTDGVYVVDTEVIETQSGKKISPCEKSVKGGDYIVAVNGDAISKKEELIKAVKDSKGETMNLTIRREEELFSKNVTPVLSNQHSYKLGIWIKDDIAGVGTMTYVDESGHYGALGHGIDGAEKEELIEITDGSLYEAEIAAINKGERGIPGSLVGMLYFQKEHYLGTVDRNSTVGIYGTISEKMQSRIEQKTIPAAFKQEIKVGPAQLYTNIDGVVQSYDIEIEDVIMNAPEANKSMLIRVTDARLLKKTGGIVQGLSGSPILQDGKIIGAVTHVLVNDPTRGYGIFIENMLEH